MVTKVEKNFKTVQFQTDLLNWYRENKRDLPWRKQAAPYHVWVSEIMLQQTRVDTVIPYYEQFMRLFPNMEHLAYAKEEAILKAWEGLGYYSRVRNLQVAVREVVEQYGGVVPRTRKEISTLKGIGPYTAGAILSIAYGQREPAVDGNVMRVLSRILHISDDIRKAATRKKFEECLYELIDPDDPGSFNQGLMELGALICTPTSPLCGVCPVQSHCQAFALGIQTSLPVKTKKKKPKKVAIASFLLQDEDGHVLIEKRPDQGLLAGLWQLPLVESASDVKAACVERYGEVIAFEKTAGYVKHVFTHLVWEIDLYKGMLRKQDAHMQESHRFVPVADLEQYTFPVSQQKLLSYAFEEGWL